MSVDRPTLSSYSARYKDRFGEEATTIPNDGKSLTMVVRGVRFQGLDFDRFQLQEVSNPAPLENFAFLHGSLSFCVIEADIPLPVATPTGTVDGLLSSSSNSASLCPRGR